MGFTANKKILVLGVANKKDLYLGTEGVHKIHSYKNRVGDDGVPAIL